MQGFSKKSISIIACLDLAHTTQLFNTSAVSPKSFKFPSGAYWILRVSIGWLVLCGVTCGYTGPTGHLGTVEEHEGDEWFHIINHCLLPLLPFPPPAGFPYSPLSSSLQPPASLRFWQLFLMLPEPPTDGILLLDCGFFIPSKSCPPFLPSPLPFCWL